MQLTLWPSAWWHNPELWRLRKLVTTISRPVEDEALDSIFYQSRAVRRHRFLPKLTWLERHVYDLDLRARKYLPHYHTEHERAQWIAEKLRGRVSGAWQVKAILDDVSYVAREYERLEAVADVYARRAAVLETINDVTAEQIASRPAA